MARREANYRSERGSVPPEMPAGSGSFGVDMRIKRMFFDRPYVYRSIEPGKLKALRKHAGRIRLYARRSMRRVSKAAAKKAAIKRKEALRRGDKSFIDPTVSRPGKPPKIHTQGNFNPKFILFGYDPNRDVVVVGPVRTTTVHNAVKTLEKGGRVPIYMGRKRRRRLVKTVFIRERPFMRPAEEATRGQWQADWAKIQNS